MVRAKTKARVDAALAAEADVAPEQESAEPVYRNIGPHKLNGVEPGGIVDLTPARARRLLAAHHVELVDAETEEDVQPGNPPADDTAGHSPEVESE